MPSVDLGLLVTINNQASAGIKQLSGDVKGLGENAQAASNRLKAIQVVIAGILLEKTLEWGKALVTAAASMQALDSRMAGLAGSAEDAAQIWGKLSDEFAGTTLSMDTITAAWNRLRVAVGSNTQTTKIVESIVNDVSAMNGTDANVDNLSESFQRLYARGYASAREFQSVFQQTGVTMSDLAKAAGTSSTQFATNLRNGFVSAESFTDAFITASQQKFGFFAQNMSSSVGGAMNLIKNSFNKGLAEIGENTNINAQLTGTFQNLAGAITSVMNSIKQPQIDAFISWLQTLEPFAVNAATALFNIGTAVLNLAQVAAGILSTLSSDQVEYGIIGYYLFGTKGIILGTLIGGIADKVKALTSGGVPGASVSLPQQSDSVMNTGIAALDGFITKLVNEVKQAPAFTGKFPGAPGPGPNSLRGSQDMGTPGIKSIFPGADQLAAIQKSQAAAQAALANAAKTPNNAGISPQEQAANAAVVAMTAKLNDLLTTSNDKVSELIDQFSGNALLTSFSKLDLQGDSFNKTINSSIAAAEALKKPFQETNPLIESLRQKEVQFADAITKAKANLQQVHDLEAQQLTIQTQIQQIQAQGTLTNLNNQANGSAAFNLALGTGAGQTMLAFYQQQLQLKQQIAQYDATINQLEIQELAVANDPAKLKPLQDQVALNEQLQTATQNSLNKLSVQGQMQQQLWQQLGATLENDVASGISGLIQGTSSLGDVARKVFADMIDMAVKYLIQLELIQAVKDSALLPFASGGVVGGGILPFANGGVPGITAFANGGITQGPTLFGLAGEAGTEAIMPLTRIGGKLGVKTTGSGGDAYHIHVNAIDTQTGMQFIGKHIKTINAGLKRAKSLNSGQQ